MPEQAPFPCPCCGYFVFVEQPGSYDICDVCGWEDDLSQLRFVTRGGANEPLVDCQRAFAQPKDWERHPYSPEERGFVRDPDWRPLDLDRDEVEVPSSGRAYGTTYADDRTAYYYWRREPQ